MNIKDKKELGDLIATISVNNTKATRIESLKNGIEEFIDKRYTLKNLPSSQVIISESDYPRAEEVHNLESIIKGLESTNEAKQRTVLDLLRKCRSGLEPFASVEFKKEIDDFIRSNER